MVKVKGHTQTLYCAINRNTSLARVSGALTVNNHLQGSSGFIQIYMIVMRI